MAEALDLTTGIAWSAVYVAAILIGFKRRTWCIPGFAICMNFAWELFVVINRLLNNAASGRAFLIQLTWLILDMFILISWLCFSKQSGSLWKNLCMLLATMGLVYLLAFCAGMWEFSVFLINLLMSFAFIWRKYYDNSPWESVLIASAKMLGTLAATLGNGVLVRNQIVLWLGGICFLADLYYLKLLLEKGERI